MSWKYRCPCGRDFATVGGMGVHSRACELCTPDARLWAAVDKDWPGGCWQWLGARQRDGYAHFNRDGKTVSVFRYVYEKLIGPIPDGLDLLHSCDNRACVYPGHLSPGTHQQNMADMMAKGRNARATRAKLTPEQVRAIRLEFRARNKRRTNSKELAERYGVGIGAICALIRGETWDHVK